MQTENIQILPVVLRGGLRIDHVDLYSISYGTAVRYGRRAGMLHWPADFLWSLWALQLLPSAALFLHFFPSSVRLSYSYICVCVRLCVCVHSFFPPYFLPSSISYLLTNWRHSFYIILLIRPPNLTDLFPPIIFILTYLNNSFLNEGGIREHRAADKSLACPGKKQANVSVTMAWISFGALPCREKRNLMTARVSMLLK